MTSTHALHRRLLNHQQPQIFQLARRSPVRQLHRLALALFCLADGTLLGGVSLPADVVHEAILVPFFVYVALRYRFLYRD
jgi:hypothetical protein